MLFNELAFLRIMKDLDDPRAVEKIKGKSWFTVSLVVVCFVFFGDINPLFSFDIIRCYGHV